MRHVPCADGQTSLIAFLVSWRHFSFRDTRIKWLWIPETENCWANANAADFPKPRLAPVTKQQVREPERNAILRFTLKQAGVRWDTSWQIHKRRQSGPVVGALALRSGDPGFKTRSDHSLNPWFNFPAAANWFASGQLRFLTVVVLFCRFVDCVSLALKSPYGEWSITCKPKAPSEYRFTL